MAIDKNLFLYDLAIVAIMKNEGPYVKEWLDYHLLAGVDHFYIYDNESPDNMKEVLQPYIERGIVTYTFYPGKSRQVEAYNEAVKNYRFFCRYMAFIDGDEFIFPQSNRSIVEVADEIFSDKPQYGGIAINWRMFGSNHQDKADYSRGVLQRFTCRADELHSSVKTIADPRKINYWDTPHYAHYFLGLPTFYDTSKDIVINHYQLKSREEFFIKTQNCSDAAYGNDDYYNMKRFNHDVNNDVFDDSILIYKKLRQKAINRKGGGQKLTQKDIIGRTLDAIIKNLNYDWRNVTPEFFNDKMETSLTCLALSREFNLNLGGVSITEVALEWIFHTLCNVTEIAAFKLLINELPNILSLDYPVTKEIHKVCINRLIQFKEAIKFGITDAKKFQYWREFAELDYILRMLKTFDSHTHK